MKGVFISTAASTLIASMYVAPHDSKRPSAVVYPLQQTKVSSKFGPRVHPISNDLRFHSGVDLPAPLGTPIRAISAGTVIFSGTLGSYGRLLSIRHRDGVSSHYAHCNEIFVEVGSEVAAGQAVASVGSTGLTTGPHLHFELRFLGAPMDPKSILTSWR